MSALAVIFPIFALVLAGSLVRRFGVMDARGMTELNRFVVWLALPALLFDITAHAQFSDIWRPGFVSAYGVSVAAVFVFTVLFRLKDRPLADATVDGLAAAYGNVGFMGFPVMAAVLGAPGLIPATIATLISGCALFAAAVVTIETGLQMEPRLLRLALKVGRSLLRNPLIVAPLAGLLAAAAGLSIPEPAEKALKMLGGTASPCALITIGLFLGARVEGSDRRAPDEAAVTAALVALKLVLQPTIALGVAMALRLPSPMTRAAVLLAAMPTGTGPFMLAEFYGREARLTSKTILISTVASAASLSACIALAR